MEDNTKWVCTEALQKSPVHVYATMATSSTSQFLFPPPWSGPEVFLFRPLSNNIRNNRFPCVVCLSLGDILYLMLHSFVVVCLFFSTFVCLPVVMAFNVVRPHHVDIKKCHFFTQGAWLPFSLLKWNWGLTDGPILYITSRFIVQGYCPHNFFKCTYWQHSKRGIIRGDPHWLDHTRTLPPLCNFLFACRALPGYTLH